ncbi:MAG TPA: hypothetical protein VM689_13140 [Aliidongia sp.]|nr:hypothetical protein [Aliidongia sp.]
MIERPQPMHDKHLDLSTVMSCKREPACFAFLCANAIASPLAIEKLNFDIASADYHGGRASVWATLEMRSEYCAAEAMALLGFDESFVRPFARALLEASTTRIAHRMTIVSELGREEIPRVVDYIRSTAGTRVRELIINPHEQVLSVCVPIDGTDAEETLFQLPRTDSFLRSFARMTSLADMVLRDTLRDMERLAKQRLARSSQP